MTVKNSILNETLTPLLTYIISGSGMVTLCKNASLRAAVWRASLVHGAKGRLRHMWDSTTAVVHSNQEGHLYSESEVIYICDIIAIPPERNVNCSPSSSVLIVLPQPSQQTHPFLSSEPNLYVKFY